MQDPYNRYIMIQLNNNNDNFYGVLYRLGPKLLPWLALGLDTFCNKSLLSLI